MSTLFTEVYNLNDSIKTDTRLFNKPINLVYQLYYTYLKQAISMFEYECYKDITDITPFSQIEYSFIGDGSSNSFTLDSIPPSNLFYISINDTEVIQGNYSYDSINNKITFTNVPLNGDSIYIASYVIGQFNSATLDFRELQILSESMNIPWQQQQLNTDRLLNQMVYGSDFKMFSQGEHIRQLNETIENQKRYIRELISKYSYTSNPKGLIGLGGGLT